MAVKISYDRSLQCSVCITKTSEKMREKRGCKVFAPRTFKGYRYSKCLGNFYNYGYASLIELHNRYQAGTLFNNGGISEQPSKYLYAMNLIGSLINDIEIEQAKEAAKKAKQKAR